MSRLIVEKVPCCVCAGTGSVPRLHFWKRDCNVCEGSGQRDIIMDADFPDHIKAQVRMDATFGINRFPRYPSPLESLVGQSFGRF